MRSYLRGRGGGGVSFGPVSTLVLGSLMLALLAGAALVAVALVVLYLLVWAASAALDGHRRLKAAKALTEERTHHAD